MAAPQDITNRPPEHRFAGWRRRAARLLSCRGVALKPKTAFGAPSFHVMLSSDRGANFSVGLFSSWPLCE